MSVSKVVVLVFLMFKCSIGVDSTKALLDRINSLERLVSEDRNIFLDKLSFVQNELYSTQRDYENLRRKFETAEKSQMILMNEIYKSKEEIKESKESLSEHVDELRRTKQELQFIKARLAESNKSNHYNGDVHDGENGSSNKSRTVNFSDPNRPGKLGNSLLKRIIPPSGDQGPKAVAFYARAGQSKEHLGILHPIVFENVVTNDGNGYDSNTGTFKAPTAGTYAFSVTLMSHYAEDVSVEIEKNGQNVGATFCGNLKTHAVCALTIVLRMETGDDFWVRIANNMHNTGNIRIYGAGFSSVSGFLIY